MMIKRKQTEKREGKRGREGREKDDDTGETDREKKRKREGREKNDDREKTERKNKEREDREKSLINNQKEDITLHEKNCYQELDRMKQDFRLIKNGLRTLFLPDSPC